MDQACKEQSRLVPVPGRRCCPEAWAAARPPPSAHPPPELLFTGGKASSERPQDVDAISQPANRHEMGFIQVATHGGWSAFQAHVFTALCNDTLGALVTSVLLMGSDRQSPLCSHWARPPVLGSRPWLQQLTDPWVLIQHPRHTAAPRGLLSV